MTTAAAAPADAPAMPPANPADDAPHLLVVDDDRRIRALLRATPAPSSKA
jgi:hypothetical protein